MSTQEIVCGTWRVFPGRIVSPEGVTEVTVINDGVNEFNTTARLQELIIALMTYLDIDQIRAVSDDDSDTEK